MFWQIYILFPLNRNWECSTKTSPFRTSSLEKGKKFFDSVSELEKSNILNRRPCFGSARIAHLWKLWEKRYSSSLKMVKETVRKNVSSLKKVDAALCIRNFRDKNGALWKSLDFFDTQIKTRRTSDYDCSRESTLRSVPLLPFDAIRLHWKIVMQILY